MALKITLKANERMVVNGCVIRNTDRRHVLIIENRADVVRGEDLLEETTEATPVRQAYFLIQTALIQPDLRDRLIPAIQEKLVDIAMIYTVRLADGVFEAANHVAVRDFYKAMAALRPLLKHEREVLDYMADQQRLGARVAAEDAAAAIEAAASVPAVAEGDSPTDAPAFTSAFTPAPRAAE
ncbi:flagellar biosynthesis repressor FlbT [Acidimangrovimonas sediminis]|uniref:flagellar biosynthesis repressor FlbT n=1 Tax=Acidimangrovimonas sediminis TaxID=2056283 RepID=UPI000C8057F8|nr:flagellar biosynthesis repressor FlbT [Acidimangrovimonas sediminis]